MTHRANPASSIRPAGPRTNRAKPAFFGTRTFISCLLEVLAVFGTYFDSRTMRRNRPLAQRGRSSRPPPLEVYVHRVTRETGPDEIPDLDALQSPIRQALNLHVF